MSIHSLAELRPRPKMDTPTGLFEGVCSCGKVCAMGTKHSARKYWLAHAVAKTAQERINEKRPRPSKDLPVERPGVAPVLDLLGLDEEALLLRDQLMARAGQLNNTSHHVGDLVANIDGMHSIDRGRRARSFGVLIELRCEWTDTDEDWALEINEDPLAERRDELVWYIQYGPDPVDVCRWIDSSFYKIPLDDPGVTTAVARWRSR